MHAQPGATTIPTTTATRRKVRFSLRGLILATAMLCTVASHVMTSWELRRVRQEARRLRDELGYLTVTDPNEVHAVALAPEAGYATKHWRWRLHLPADRKFRVCYKFAGLPVEGLPDDNDGFFDDVAGEMSLAASAVREPTGSWRLVLHYDSPRNPYPQTRTQTIENDGWLAEDASMSWSQAGAKTTESVEPGEPMVLLRLRRSKAVTFAGGGTGQTVEANPTEGLMLWIEEVHRR
jgi:hypothetical protein